MASIGEFIKDYVRAVSQGYAAIFAGAGLSRGSGHTNWRELVRPLAEEIGLDVDKESDLVAIAQYYCNEHGSRSSINQRILNEYTKNTTKNENIEIITRMPIKTYWTTNYDELLENALKENNRKADVKTTQDSLANNIYDRDAVVYKMHGDVRCPAKAVLTKDDYELYGNKHPLFRTVLQGDLVSKTFLFIGFSFEDPNLDYILSQIRALLGESTRDHYCFFEHVKRQEDESESDYLYKVTKQGLRVKDLRRYGIQAILLDSYSEITDILKRIEHGYLLKNIFVSGSLAVCEPPWDENSVMTFMHGLAKKLVKLDYRIISGFGLGIGSTIVNGALEEIMESKYKHVDEHLCLRPFPQIISGSISRDQLWNNYREDMIALAGIAVFIFGNKKAKNGELIIADGMLREFTIARDNSKLIIPVGSTGGAAAEIYAQVKQDIATYPYLTGVIDELATETDPNRLVDLVCGIIRKQQLI